MAGILNIQIKSLMSDKEANLRKIEHYIKFNKDKKLDLVVMPEFFSTNIGYQSAPEDENGGDTIKFIQNLAKKYNTNIIAGSVVRKVGDKYYNTSFAIDRSGEIIAKYDKIHLFNYMGGTEGKFTTCGKDYVIAHFDFAKVGMEICFDIRYPQMYRELVRKGAQIVVLPTAWLIPKELYQNEETRKYAQDMWISMNRTRAFDNMTYFIVSNQTKEVNDTWGAIGYSSIISPTAQVLECAEEKECAIYADIDIETVKCLKSMYPICEID
jgi:nitrilase